MKKHLRVRAKIDLDAINHNADRLISTLPDDTQMIAVIKADGYGHGALPIAKMFDNKDRIWGVAIATADEGLALRKAGFASPIMILGATFQNELEDIINNDIRMCLYDSSWTDEIVKAAKKCGKKAIIHIKVDTGMGRLGFPPTKEGIEDIVKSLDSEWIEHEGIFTHFSKADEKDKSFTYEQLKKFDEVINELKKKNIIFKYHHTSNSAGIIDRLGNDKELVRAGIALYGLRPSREVDFDSLGLIPAMTLCSSVIFVKDIPKGTSISYGGTFVSDKDMKVATIPVGYGDGYPRSLSGKAYVLIHGKKAPILGRVCMDQFIVDVTNIENVKSGDEVILVGKSGNESIFIDDLGEMADRFNYEFACDIGKRIPRDYYKNGELVEQVDYFL